MESSWSFLTHTHIQLLIDSYGMGRIPLGSSVTVTPPAHEPTSEKDSPTVPPPSCFGEQAWKTDSGLKWSQNSLCAISKQSFLVVAVDFYTLSLHKRCLQRLHWWGVNGRAEKPSIYRLLCIDLHHIQSHINFYCSTNTALWEVECIKSRNPAIDKSVHLE